MDIHVNMPDIGLDEVEVTEILVIVGDKVDIEQSLITVEGEKSSMEIPSSASGIVKEIHIKVGNKIKTSDLIMTFSLNNDIANSNIELVQKLDEKKNKLTYSETLVVHATPLIRRLARKLNINLNDITPSGRKNRILKKDLQLSKLNSRKNVINNITNDINHSFSQKMNKHEYEEISLTAIQKAVGYKLSNSWNNIPHVTQFDEVNITKLEKFRKKYNNEQNKKITILVFIIKVLAYSLAAFPRFNSSLSLDKTKIILKKYINIGIAVDILDGLVVPVIKNVNQKNILEIDSDLKSISIKAREGKLEKIDTQDSCFTISSLGGIGGSFFSPIINSPEVAILGVSKSLVKPYWNNKQFIPQVMLPLSLSYDHRVINGAEAARFITFIGKILSDMHLLVM